MLAMTRAAIHNLERQLEEAGEEVRRLHAVAAMASPPAAAAPATTTTSREKKPQVPLAQSARKWAPVTWFLLPEEWAHLAGVSKRHRIVAKETEALMQMEALGDG